MADHIEQLKLEKLELCSEIELRDERINALQREASVMLESLNVREEELGLEPESDGAVKKASLLLSVATAREDNRRLQLELSHANTEREALRGQVSKLS